MNEIAPEELYSRILGVLSERRSHGSDIPEPQAFVEPQSPALEPIPVFPWRRAAGSEPDVPQIGARRSGLHVNDLLAFDDLNFVLACYREILRREPDPGGFYRYLELLDRGLPKVLLIARMRYGREGRAAGVAVAGLISRLPSAVFQEIGCSRIRGNVRGLLRLARRLAGLG